MVCETLLEFSEHESSILRTGRLVLCRPRAEDAVGIARLANDKTIAENTASIPHPYTLAHAQAFVARIAEGKADAFLAFTSIDGVCTPVGMGGFSVVDGMADLGYWVGADHRGQGFATEIARGLLDYAFEKLEADKVTASCRVTNTASRRVIEKCGFQWQGCGLATSLGVRGSFPVDRFRLDRRIWESLIAWGHGRRERWPAAARAVTAGTEIVTQ